MQVIRWMSLEGVFREVGRTSAETVKAALERIREVYPEAKLVEDSDNFRVTAKSLGGRPGRNVAFIENDESFLDGPF